ncbi:protein tincar-like protein [Lates japonicus]|uniref:Protein tincar-like protein n=1 Tax=Lates japonicus TaxID=270547 RepID=A0AAD3RFW1_LATJO|nr:protein tincar-like protein [Lates japonicus]
MLKVFVLGCLLCLTLANPMDMGHKRVARSESNSRERTSSSSSTLIPQQSNLMSFLPSCHEEEPIKLNDFSLLKPQTRNPKLRLQRRCTPAWSNHSLAPPSRWVPRVAPSLFPHCNITPGLH